MCEESWCVRLWEKGVPRGWGGGGGKLSEIPQKGVEQKRGEKKQRF